MNAIAKLIAIGVLLLARGARAKDFMDTSLMEEIKKTGFIDRLYAGKE